MNKIDKQTPSNEWIIKISRYIHEKENEQNLLSSIA